MSARRNRLPRRTFLRGLGATVALPFLNEMTPALGASERDSKPVRLVFTYLPNGIIMKDWTPATEGADFVLPRTLAPLEPFRKDMLVLTGLKDNTGNALGDAGGDHARASATYLTGVHPKKTSGADIRAGISVDQIAAQAVGSKTRFPSLELTLDYTRNVGTCDSGYSCAYMDGLSWRSPSSPLPPESNPRLVFERLFGTDDFSDDAATRLRRAQLRASILDLVREDTRSLTAKLGTSDRHKIDEYLYSIREVENRIQSAEKQNLQIDPPIEKPSGIPAKFSEHARLMFDLQAIALQGDLTRVVTFMLGREIGNPTFPEIGVSEPHHALSHHRNNPEWIEKLAQIDLFHTTLFAYFAGKLKDIREGDGTLLDQCMIVYGGGLSDASRHSHENLPTLLLGKGGGAFKMGRHLAYPLVTPLTNLYLTLLDRMGLKPESIGDSTGRLEHLTDI
jgi:hypothetical protein